MNILVTGGAGYIGSVAVKRLIEQQHTIVVYDNLSKGLSSLVDPKAQLVIGDLLDKTTLEAVFKSQQFDVVMQFAAYKDAGESMVNLPKYSQNIVGIINILDLMQKYKTPKIIFSSTAAVYGNPQYLPIDESHPKEPINYYGSTKLQAEQLIQWYSNIYGLKYIIFRYFNVIGDGGLKYIDPKPSNISPIIMEVLSGKRPELQIFGNDYDTTDGTCIRDYIDVNDLVEAHITALQHEQNDIFNLSTNKGASVVDLISIVEKLTGQPLKKTINPRRLGDPAILTATAEKAKKLLNWQSKTTLETSIQTTLDAYFSEPINRQRI